MSRLDSALEESLRRRLQFGDQVEAPHRPTRELIVRQYTFASEKGVQKFCL